MLSEIRVAFFGAAVSVAIIGLHQTSIPRLEVPLENEYVNVTVVPEAKIATHIIADCVSVTGRPFVRLYLPAHPIDPTPAAPRGSNLQSIWAAYILPDELFGCSGPIRGIFVDIDLKSIPARGTFKDDAVTADPAHNELLLDNKRVRVVRVHFGPGESGPIVDKRPRVIVAVTDSRATVTFPDGHSELREMKAGTVSFGNAGRQATKNTGTTPLENIVVELKSK